MTRELHLSRFEFVRFMPQIIVLTLFASGALVLAWIGYLTWNDISVWNKDIGSIFFGSRTGEAISLGIGMAVIHYLLIGVSLLAGGTVLFLRNRIGLVKPNIELKAPQKVKQIQKTSTEKPVVKRSIKEENAAAREERFFSGCLHHFGYLSSRPKESPIPQECIICQRLGDCMVATVYVNKIKE